MGVIKQGILGGFSGSVGNVVGTSWKGIAVIKAKPLSVANPKTASQVNNRSGFSLIVAFATSILVAAIKPLLDRTAVKMSGYNLFMQMNRAIFDETELVTPQDLIIAKGSVTDVALTGVEFDRSANTLVMSYSDNTGTGDALATDVLYRVYYNENLAEAIAFSGAETRASTTASDPMPANWQVGDMVWAWAAFRRADGSRTSNTVSDNEAIVA